MIPTCWQKSISLTVLLHWSPGKVIHNPQQWGIQKAVNTKFIDSFGALALSGQLSCTHPLPSKHCCSRNTGKLSEEMPRVASEPDRWTLRLIHTWLRCHSGPLMQMYSSLYHFFLYGKAFKLACMTGSWITFLDIHSFFSHYTTFPRLSFLLSCPSSKDLYTSKGPRDWLAAMWPEDAHGREGRPENEAVLTCKRRCRKERGRTGITQAQRQEESKGNWTLASPVKQFSRWFKARSKRDSVKQRGLGWEGVTLLRRSQPWFLTWSHSRRAHTYWWVCAATGVVPVFPWQRLLLPHVTSIVAVVQGVCRRCPSLLHLTLLAS